MPPDDPARRNSRVTTPPAPWSGLGEAAAHRLAQATRRIQTGRGGALPPGCGVVIDGVLAVAAETEDGRRAFTQLLRPGDVIDADPELDAPAFWVEPLTETKAMIGSVEAIERLVREEPDAAVLWINQLRDQISRLRRHCLDLATKSPAERLAAALLELHGRDAAGEIALGRIRLPIQHADVAEYLGVTPETVSRAMRQLAAEGAIVIEERGAVSLVDADALARIALGARPSR